MLRIPPFRVPITRLIICVFCGAWQAKLRLAFIFFVVLGEVIISPLKILRPHCRVPTGTPSSESSPTATWVLKIIPATALQAEVGGRWRGRRETKTCRSAPTFMVVCFSPRQLTPRRNASQWLLGTFCHQKVQIIQNSKLTNLSRLTVDGLCRAGAF